MVKRRLDPFVGEFVYFSEKFVYGECKQNFLKTYKLSGEVIMIGQFDKIEELELGFS